MRITRTFVALALGSAIATTALAQVGGESIVKLPDQIVWKGPAVSPGPSTAVLYGDSSKAGVFVSRTKFPAGFKVMPHTQGRHPDHRHGTDRHYGNPAEVSMVLTAGALSTPVSQLATEHRRAGRQQLLLLTLRVEENVNGPGGEAAIGYQRTRREKKLRRIVCSRRRPAYSPHRC
jgi:hypothetical protein